MNRIIDIALIVVGICLMAAFPPLGLLVVLSGVGMAGAQAKSEAARRQRAANWPQSAPRSEEDWLKSLRAW